MLPIATTVEAAFGADLTADPITWVWTDISSRALGKVQVTSGRVDESSQTQPTDCQLRLSNTDGWLTPRHPSSPWYLQWGLGTPVRVRVLPTGSVSPTASDLFTRSVSNSWGTATSGHAWTTSGGSASDYSVSGTAGLQSNGSVGVLRTAVLDIGGTDFDVTVDVSFPLNSTTSAPVTQWVLGRYADANNYYVAQLQVGTAGAVNFFLYKRVAGVLTGPLGVNSSQVGSGHTAGDVWHIRFQGTGAALQAKAWLASASQPRAWTLVASDGDLTAGTKVGVGCRLETGNTDTLPVVFTFDNFSAVSPVGIQAQGNVASIRPVWPTGNVQYAEALVDVKGALWRLNQSPLLRSALYRCMTSASPAPVAYWSVEDGTASTSVASGLPGGQPLTARGTVKFAATTGPVGSGQLADLTGGGQLAGSVPQVSSTSWRLEFATIFATIPAANFTAVMQVTSPGAVSLWEIDATDLANGGLYLQYVKNGAATQVYSNKKIDDGLWHWIQLDVQQSGADVAWLLYVDGVAFASGTITSVTLTPISGITVNPTGGSTESTSGVGHIAVWAPLPVTSTSLSAFRGYAGETANARMNRLCAEQNVAGVIVGGIEAMGPQSIAKFVDLLRECEAADGGMLLDGMHAGVTYIGRDFRENLSASLVLDANSRHVKLPFEPVEDDQRIITDATVTRQSGSSAQYADTAKVASAGDYLGGGTINVSTDAALSNHASWLVHLSTVDEMRAPVVVLELAAHPELVASWLAMDVAKRYTVANLPAQYPPGGLDLVLEQCVQTWNSASWRIELTGSPFAPWRVMVAAADSGDTGTFIGRFETESSALNAGITTTATSFAVKTNAGPLWTTTADDFPFDIDLEGEQVRVTNITGASSPQTFTVTRSINGVVKAHNANAPVFLFHAPVVGL